MAAKASIWASLKTMVWRFRASHGHRGPSTGVMICHLPRHMSRKPIQKQSSQGSNKYPNEMLMLASRGSTIP